MTRILTPETDYGQFRCGEINRNARLSIEDVQSIRVGLGIGISRRALAETHGVSLTTIGDIARNETWRWLK